MTKAKKPNIFFINDGSQSNANNQILKVYINKPEALSVDDLNESSIDSLNLIVYPNPNDGNLKISFNLTKTEDITLTIYDLKGAIIDKTKLKNLSTGINHYEKEIKNLKNGSVYLISLETENQKTTHQLVIKR